MRPLTRQRRRACNTTQWRDDRGAQELAETTPARGKPAAASRVEDAGEAGHGKATTGGRSGVSTRAALVDGGDEGGSAQYGNRSKAWRLRGQCEARLNRWRVGEAWLRRVQRAAAQRTQAWRRGAASLAAVRRMQVGVAGQLSAWVKRRHSLADLLR